jgi:hypothetical protein
MPLALASSASPQRIYLRLRLRPSYGVVGCHLQRVQPDGAVLCNDFRNRAISFRRACASAWRRSRRIARFAKTARPTAAAYFMGYTPSLGSCSVKVYWADLGTVLAQRALSHDGPGVAHQDSRALPAQLPPGRSFGCVLRRWRIGAALKA